MKIISFVNMVDPYSISCTQTPLGIISLYGVLVENGISAEICDLNYKYYKHEITVLSKFNDNLHIMAEEILKNNPQIVSIYSMCNTYYMAILVSRIIKSISPSTIVILAGPHATLVAEETLNTFDFIDYIGMGEGEETIVTTVNSIMHKNMGNLRGVGYRSKNGGIVLKWNRLNRIDIDKLKIVDICRFNEIKDFNGVISIEGGRGCPFKCVFCSTQEFWGNIFQVKSVEKILSEIKYYYNKYSITDFLIQHDLFTFNKKHIIDFCNEIIKENYNINWACSSRIDTIDNETLEKMKSSGCSNIFYGVESGSPQMQKMINKNLKLEKVTQVIEWMLSLGMSGTFSFIYGFPQETDYELNKTIMLIYNIKKKNLINKGIDLNINISRLCFLPGTELGKNYYDQLIFNGLDGLTFYNDNIKIEEDVQELIKKNKKIFLHCYNLPKNITVKMKYLGYFFMILFNDLYFSFHETLDIIFERYSFDFVSLYDNFYFAAAKDIIKLCDYKYGTYEIKKDMEKKLFIKIIRKIIKLNKMKNVVHDTFSNECNAV